MKREYFFLLFLIYGTISDLSAISTKTIAVGVADCFPADTVIAKLIRGAIQDSGGQVYNVKAFGAIGDGITDDGNAIRAAIDSLPTTGGELYFPPSSGEYIISSNIAFPSKAVLNISKGAVLNIDTGDTLRIYGGIKAGNHQIFSGNGAVIFEQGAGTDVYADWWGIVYNDTAVDNSVNIQKAIHSGVSVSWDFAPGLKTRGKNIYFSNGTVTVKNTIYLYSGIRLIGAGGGQLYTGTLIDVRDMENDTVFVFDAAAYTGYYHFGGLERMWIEPLDGKRPWAAIYISQAGENCVLRDLSIYRCHRGVVYGTGVAATSQVSSTMTNVTLHEHDKAAIEIRKSVGNVWFQNISGDGNRIFANVLGGGTTSLSISFDGFKVEGGTLAQAPWKDSSTVVRLQDFYGTLLIKNGWIGTDTVTAWNQDVVRIVGSGQPQVQIYGCTFVNMRNMVMDSVKSVAAPVRSGHPYQLLYSEPFLYNTVLTNYGAFVEQIRTTGSDISLGTADKNIFVDASAASRTITLKNPNYLKGHFVTILKTDVTNNAVTVKDSSNFLGTLKRQGSSLTFWSDSTKWHLINSVSAFDTIPNEVFTEKITNLGKTALGNGALLNNNTLVEILGQPSGIQLLLSDNTTNSSSKVVRIGAVHYNNSEEPMAIIHANTTSENNFLEIGGGTSLFNAATRMSFYTAGTTTTTLGTERLGITSAGNVVIGSVAGVGLDSLFIVRGGVRVEGGLLTSGNIRANGNFYHGATLGYLSSVLGSLTPSGKYVATSSGGSPTTQLYYVTKTINGVTRQFFVNDVP